MSDTFNTTTAASSKPKRRRKLRIADWRLNLLTPQALTVFDHLNEAGTITQREALMDHSVQSLTRRITELRQHGFDISGVWKKHPTTGQRYMRYSLVA